MTDALLSEPVDEIFRFALDRTDGQPGLQALRHELEQGRARLAQRMRVAIVGRIKAGKSTLVNALLGKALVATGREILTFNVNRLRFAAQPSLVVHFKDGRPPEPHELRELEALTRRPTEHREFLQRIRYIEVFDPSPILQTFDITDTPGLDSPHEADAQNALADLGLPSEELTAATQAEATGPDGADAVLYLFRGGMAHLDQAITAELQGPALFQASPINAIGVLTMVDSYWPQKADPMAEGKEIARRWAEHPRVRPVLYGIRPVCGLLGLGAQTLTEEEFETLAQLAVLPARRFDSLIRYAEEFIGVDEPEIPVPPAQRAQVLGQLGQYGVWLACRLIREGIPGRAQLAGELFRRSGIADLIELIRAHFGRRAFVIQLDAALQRITSTCIQARRGVVAAERPILDEVARRFGALRDNEHAFAELEALRAFYAGRLEFTPAEGQQLLEVTGEYGATSGERLGLRDPATLATVRTALTEMLRVARERRRDWQQRVNDFGASGETIAAARVLRRSYELIEYHVGEAMKHLGL